jgi:hypothetical protein
VSTGVVVDGSIVVFGSVVAVPLADIDPPVLVPVVSSDDAWVVEPSPSCTSSPAAALATPVLSNEHAASKPVHAKLSAFVPTADQAITAA